MPWDRTAAAVAAAVVSGAVTAWLATIFFVLCAALALIASKSDMGNQQSELRHEIIMQESGLNDVAKNAANPETAPDAPAPVTSDKK